MARRRAGKLRVQFDENVTARLNRVTVGLHGPRITTEVHHAASYIASAVRRRAPVGKTGALQRGVYVVSRIRNEQPSIQRRGHSIVQGLRYPPVPGQALVVSGTYYSQWVERGRKARVADSSRGTKHERRAVGRGRRHPFFAAGVREARPTAESFLRRRIARIVQESYDK